MRERSLVHVAGPGGAGKTTFVERLLDAEVAFAICVRAERDGRLRKEQESAPRRHPELRRYRDAGASAVALYRFAKPDTDAFFTSGVMQDYSEAVFIEGDCPIELVDLSVFVAPPTPVGGSLLERVTRDHAAAHQASIEQIEQALESADGTARLLAAGLGRPLLARPELLEGLRRSMKAKLAEVRGAPRPAPTEHWALVEGYAGIERAHLVIVNVHSEADRGRAERLLEDLARIRQDDHVYRDVVGFRGSKVPVTAVVAELSDPKDPGLKKALARVRRAARRRQP